MTPNKPIGTAKVELPEPKRYSAINSGHEEDSDSYMPDEYGSVILYKDFQAYIQQPSPLVGLDLERVIAAMKTAEELAKDHEGHSAYGVLLGVLSVIVADTKAALHASPLVLAPSIGATDARAGEAKGNSEGTEPGISSPLVEENEYLKTEMAMRARACDAYQDKVEGESALLVDENRRLVAGLKKAGGNLNFALPANTPVMVHQRVAEALKNIRAALAQPETKGEQ